MLKPLFAYGKPVIITEFGHTTFQGTTSSSVMGSGIGLGVVDYKTQFLHRIPLLGRFVRPRKRCKRVNSLTLLAYLMQQALTARLCLPLSPY
jgi:hypothetical protein